MAKDYPGAFAALRTILSKHARGMTVESDTPNTFTVVTRAIAPNGKPLWFGCVMSKKSAVTYHLIPPYYNPKLLQSMPPELAPRMQGKTCFNFAKQRARVTSAAARKRRETLRRRGKSPVATGNR